MNGVPAADDPPLNGGEAASKGGRAVPGAGAVPSSGGSVPASGRAVPSRGSVPATPSSSKIAASSGKIVSREGKVGTSGGKVASSSGQVGSDNAPGSRRRRAGLISSLVGVAAAGAAAGVATERALLYRRRRSTERDPYRDEPFGALPADDYRTIMTDEGIPLHVEITGDPEAPLTVVFVHGFCLDLGTFHFQRKALSKLEGVRTVSYDQPGHGRSGRLDKGEYTFDLLAEALRKVIEETTPRGKIVLVGHSMGGMAIMALADAHPEMFSSDTPRANHGRIAGTVMISTSAGEMSGVTFGMPQVLVRFRKPLLPLLSGAGWVTAGMLDRAREASTDLAWMLTRRYGFGSGKISPALVSYVERMNSATRTESVARYLRAIYTHDRVVALAAFKDIPVLVMCGDEDVLTPVAHSQAICEALPHAELVLIPKAGHAALLEHSEAVNEAMLPFVHRISSEHP